MVKKFFSFCWVETSLVSICVDFLVTAPCSIVKSLALYVALHLGVIHCLSQFDIANLSYLPVSVIKTLNSRDICGALSVEGPWAHHVPLAATLWVHTFFQVAFPITSSMPSDHNISWIEEYHRRYICKESFLTKELANILGKKKIKPFREGRDKAHSMWAPACTCERGPTEAELCAPASPHRWLSFLVG